MHTKVRLDVGEYVGAAVDIGLKCNLRQAMYKEAQQNI